MGVLLVVCPDCQMRGNADHNASLKIGQRLLARYQPDRQNNDQEEKPQAPQPRAKRSVKTEGVSRSQDAKSEEPPSLTSASRHGTAHGHGTAQKGKRREGQSGQQSV
jgi:hypothetical protein